LLKLISIYSLYRFRKSDTKLLLKQQQSGMQLKGKTWWAAMFDFETRINVAYDFTKKPASLSTKGSFMKIANTFLYTFTFAIRQFVLVFLLTYMFAAVAEYLFEWMPCTVQDNFGTYVTQISSDEDLKGERSAYVLSVEPRAKRASIA